MFFADYVQHSCNLSSHLVEDGPSIVKYKPNDATIFIDAENLKCEKSLFDEGERCWRTDTTDVLCQLRQVRSKFNKLSTYTLCRASSYSTANHIHKLLTIWNFCDRQGVKVVSGSFAKEGSKLFKAIALEVIKKGRNAVLKKEALLDLCSGVAQSSQCYLHLSRIVEIFGEEDSILPSLVTAK